MTGTNNNNNTTTTMGQRSSSNSVLGNADYLASSRRPSSASGVVGNVNVNGQETPKMTMKLTCLNDTNPGEDAGVPNGMDMTQNIRSSSYSQHRRSTASLTSLFRKRRWKKRRGSISASFSINDNDIKVELLNVNAATEEELMTLPNVNRTLARNIINHRQAIGGFRKVEDLALVSGMGATKLDFIRPEICISTRRKALSRASSKTASMESIPSTVESTTMMPPRPPRPIKLINVNTATIFDLMAVNGINQALAARIITYRERKGPFSSIDDLKHVGISYKRLGAIRMHFTTEDLDYYSSADKMSTRSSNNISPVSRSHSYLSTKSQIKGNSLPMGVKPYPILEGDGGDSDNNNSVTSCSMSKSKNENLNAQIQDLQSIYELMSVKTARPKKSSDFNFTHNSRPAYRIATWNLDSCTADKISNPGVLEVITRTILENGFSIIALQEVCDKKALEKICQELNEPTLPKNREWQGHRGLWKGVLHSSSVQYKNEAHHLGILYDSEKIDEISIQESNATPFQNGSLWQYGVFTVQVKGCTWILINVLAAALEGKNYTNGHVQNPNNSKDVMDSIKSLVKETDGALILGHFNAKHAQKGLEDLHDLERIMPDPKNEPESSGPNSLWVTSDLKGYLTNETGTVEHGLNHIAIPNGWSLNGRATKTGPLWMTIYRNMPKTTYSNEINGNTTTCAKTTITTSTLKEDKTQTVELSNGSASIA